MNVIVFHRSYEVKMKTKIITSKSKHPTWFHALTNHEEAEQYDANSKNILLALKNYSSFDDRLDIITDHLRNAAILTRPHLDNVEESKIIHHCEVISPITDKENDKLVALVGTGKSTSTVVVHASILFGMTEEEGVPNVDFSQFFSLKGVDESDLTMFGNTTLSKIPVFNSIILPPWLLGVIEQSGSKSPQHIFMVILKHLEGEKRHIEGIKTFLQHLYFWARIPLVSAPKKSMFINDYDPIKRMRWRDNMHKDHIECLYASHMNHTTLLNTCEPESMEFDLEIKDIQEKVEIDEVETHSDECSVITDEQAREVHLNNPLGQKHLWNLI